VVVPDPVATVMVQWALGAGVAKWTRELGPLLAAGPPEVKLVFDPPAPQPKTGEKP
jgi:glutamine synthetase type III